MEQLLHLTTSNQILTFMWWTVHLTDYKLFPLPGVPRLSPAEHELVVLDLAVLAQVHGTGPQGGGAQGHLTQPGVKGVQEVQGVKGAKEVHDIQENQEAASIHDSLQFIECQLWLWPRVTHTAQQNCRTNAHPRWFSKCWLDLSGETNKVEKKTFFVWRGRTGNSYWFSNLTFQCNIKTNILAHYILAPLINMA